jgi:hypothetical protein
METAALVCKLLRILDVSSTKSRYRFPDFWLDRDVSDEVAGVDGGGGEVAAARGVRAIAGGLGDGTHPLN